MVTGYHVKDGSCPDIASRSSPQCGAVQPLLSMTSTYKSSAVDEIGDRLATIEMCRFCTDDRRVSLYLQWDAPSPSELPLPMGDLYGPHLIYGSRGPPES